MNLSVDILMQFQQFIWNFYRDHRRDFAWRSTDDPYHITLSEIMLQQTQTARVAIKYTEFIQQFPTLYTLADAPLRQVLEAWQGLGYNRRGKFLHDMARIIVAEHAGIIPDDPQVLQTLPGIGTYTSGSICAFAYNKPTVFIETNIRAVYLHTFFQGSRTIADKELMPLIAATIDQDNPRDWYYALMDYGAYLKKSVINPCRKSKHHAIQSKFEGSDRQIRGMILRLLLKDSMTLQELCAVINREPVRIARIVEQIHTEGLIQKQDNYFCM